MEFPGNSPLLRIGELSRRLGISDHVLRAWENRYGLLQPVRSPGGFRLYSEADERRIRRMQAYLADGLSAAFDEPAAQAVLDRLLADLSVPAVLRDVVLPYLAELGERWQRGTASVALEHFARNVIRGRLAGLARGWGSGHGPQALLACPPGELHDVPLMVFGIVLHGRPGSTTRNRSTGQSGRRRHANVTTGAARRRFTKGRCDDRLPHPLGPSARAGRRPGAGRPTRGSGLRQRRSAASVTPWA